MRIPLLIAALWLASIPATATGQVADSVWVNTRSGVYHCRGTEFFGRTARGEFLPEAEAVTRGHRANGGRLCSAATPVQGIAGLPPEGRAPNAEAPVLPANLTTTCTVASITDGDTFVCAGHGPIRPIGMDAPERAQEPFYTAARAALVSLIAVGDTVYLESDNTPRDKYGRVLAYVWHRGEMVNWVMVRRGWAVALPYPATSRYGAHFEAAERAAEREGRGLWYVKGFACRPKDNRDGRC